VNTVPRTRGFLILVLSIMTAVSVEAANIQGTVVIKKKLTKRRVTAQVPMYERGTAVDLGADEEGDPLAFERSRVAVYLEGRFSEASAAIADDKPMLKMEQTNRRFSPETLVIAAGAKVSFPNHDPIFHNVFSLSGPKTFDLGNYPKGDTRIVMFPEPGIVYVNCHLHPNMTATIVVAPNKWNTRVDREGQFELQDVPPGKYTIVAWHKAAGFFRQTVEVTTASDERVEFLIPIDENGRTLGTQGLVSQKTEPQRAEQKKQE
jgi:plastocyanin